MGLDIALLDEDGEEVIAMNWLRNSFGLCNWAEDHISEFAHKPDKEHSLWYAINHWSYAEAKNVDRELFLNVVNNYWEVIRSLGKGYYFFDLPGYRQFVEGKTHLMPQENGIFGPRIREEKYAKDRRLMIPMENFYHPKFNLREPNLPRYQEWFGTLVEFAKLLQDERYTYYCSN